jgi:hypothetical protein
MTRLLLGCPTYVMQVLSHLTTVDRDEDAYNLVKYFGLGKDGFAACGGFKETYKGDWIYLTGQDKTEDFYNEVLGGGTMTDDWSAWSWKLALVAMKMKTINALKGSAKIFDCFAEELVKSPENYPAQKVSYCWPVMDCIQTCVLGYKRSKIEQQEEHLQTYLKALTNISDAKDLLQYLLKPNLTMCPIRFRDNPHFYDDSMNCAFQLFQRIPRALETLEQFYHSIPDQ